MVNTSSFFVFYRHEEQTCLLSRQRTLTAATQLSVTLNGKGEASEMKNNAHQTTPT